MTSQIHPQLSHCGVYARDIDKMVAFYTQTIGLVVSDRGISSRGGELAFMTAAPGHHHQLVVASGRAPEGVSTVNQLSFKIADLDQLKETHRRVRDAGIAEIRQTSHGNALSIYFPDPEGNRIELFVDTPWHTPQPVAEPFDIEAPVETIFKETEALCRNRPGFVSRAEWRKSQVARMGG